MKNFYLFLLFVISNSLSFAVEISGTVLVDEGTHNDILISFIAKSPSSVSTSISTDASGDFSTEVEIGTYDVRYTKEGYDTIIFSDVFFTSNTVLKDTTLGIIYDWTDVSGEISGIWSNKKYRIIGDITIPLNDTLIITSGIKILLEDDQNINVLGGLIIQGNENDLVSIDGNHLSHIIVSNTNDNTNGFLHMSHTTVSEPWIHISGKHTGTLKTLDVSHCSFSSTRSNPIVIDECENLSIYDATFVGYPDTEFEDPYSIVFKTLNSPNIQFKKIHLRSRPGLKVESTTSALSFHFDSCTFDTLRNFWIPDLLVSTPESTSPTSLKISHSTFTSCKDGLSRNIDSTTIEYCIFEKTEIYHSKTLFTNNIMIVGSTWNTFLSDNTITNNTFVNSEIPFFGNGVGEPSSVSNNIFYNSSIIFSSFEGVFRNNLLYNAGISGDHSSNGLGQVLITNRNGTPSDIYYNIIDEDPDFISTQKGDINYFRCASSSPAINAGVNENEFLGAYASLDLVTNYNLAKPQTIIFRTNEIVSVENIKHYRIYDLNGRLFLSGDHAFNIDISSLSTGSYLLIHDGQSSLFMK